MFVCRKGNNGTHGSGSSKQEGSANVKVLFEPLQLGGVSNLDELEVKTLKFQNQKLGLRLTQRLAIEEEHRRYRFYSHLELCELIDPMGSFLSP